MAGDAPQELVTKHAQAIGLLCIYTASLDNAIVRLIERLSGQTSDETACFVEAAIDISQRCGIAKRFVLAKVSEPAWRDCVVGILNLVENQIAPRRNRCVHDDWYISESQMVRVNTRVKIKTPQARQQPKLVFSESKVATVEEIHLVIEAAIEAAAHLSILSLSYEFHARNGTPLRAPPPLAILLSRHTFPETLPQGGRVPPMPSGLLRPKSQ